MTYFYNNKHLDENEKNDTETLKCNLTSTTGSKQYRHPINKRNSLVTWSFPHKEENESVASQLLLSVSHLRLSWFDEASCFSEQANNNIMGKKDRGDRGEYLDVPEIELFITPTHVAVSVGVVMVIIAWCWGMGDRHAFCVTLPNHSTYLIPVVVV